MKNIHMETLKKNHRKVFLINAHLFKNNLYSTHIYDNYSPINAWEQFYMIRNKKIIHVFWEHPRFKYINELNKYNQEQMKDFKPNKPSSIEKNLDEYFLSRKNKRLKIHKKTKDFFINLNETDNDWNNFDKILTDNFNKIKKIGIDIEINPKMSIKRTTKGLSIHIIAPFDSEPNGEHLQEMVRIINNILDGDKFNNIYNKPYSKTDWFHSYKPKFEPFGFSCNIDLIKPKKLKNKTKKQSEKLIIR